MRFSEALAELQMATPNIAIFRPSWNGNAEFSHLPRPRQFVQVQRPDAHSKMNNPYLYIVQPNGLTPWVPSQGDLFAEDWEVLAVLGEQ